MARVLTYTLLVLASQLMLKSAAAQTCTDIMIVNTPLNLTAGEDTTASLRCVYSAGNMQFQHKFRGEVIDIVDTVTENMLPMYDLVVEFPNYMLNFEPTVHQRHQGVYFCSPTNCDQRTESVAVIVQGAPYLEYKVSLGLEAPEYMLFQAMTAGTVNITFNTFGSPEATVSLYRMQTDGTYQLDMNTRIMTTDCYITISDILPSDDGAYLITAVNTYGPSINNLTFDLMVMGVGPPTITIDRSIVAPIEYNENDCSDFLNSEGGSNCRFNCSVPADAYDGSNTLSIHWEFNSAMVPLTGEVRQEIVLDGNPPHTLLIFSGFNKDMNGEYICYSSNTHSNDDKTVKIIGPPDMVVQGETKAIGTSGVFLTWDKPNSFGAEITQYIIGYRQTGSNDNNMNTKVINATEDDLTVTIDGFCPAGHYLFRVAAINMYGVQGEYDEGEIFTIQEDNCPTTTSTSDPTITSTATPSETTIAAVGNISAIVGGAVAGFILLVFVAMILFGGLFCYRGFIKYSSRRHAETRWTPPNDYGYEEKSPEPMLDTIGIHSLVPATPAYDFCSIDAHYEFPRENLELTDILLDGVYSVIYKANAQGIKEEKTVEVAVKTIKDEYLNIDEYESHLMLEMEQMANMDAHPNVVRLLKVCTVGRPIYMVMEYMCHGDLLGFLRATRGRENMYTMFPGIKERPTHVKLTSRDLLNIITQVASGMHFLSQNKIVHGHLCARNVLVSTNMEVKVFNVGLYNLHNDETYETVVRWLAPELFGPNTMRTMFGDIWAFGIMMWEVVTLGGTPYAEIMPQEIFPQLLDGMRLQRPQHCAQPVYDVMSQCWSSEPTMRPFFSDIYNRLNNLNVSKMSYLDLRNYNDSVYSQFETYEKEPMSVL